MQHGQSAFTKSMDFESFAPSRRTVFSDGIGPCQNGRLKRPWFSRIRGGGNSMGKSDAFPTRGKSLKRKKFLLVAPPGTAVQQNPLRGPTEYWIGLRNPYAGRWVPPAGGSLTAEFALSPKSGCVQQRLMKVQLRLPLVSLFPFT